ncbi:MAG: hypothetical protein QXI64_10710 [Sulfolobales archaeon]
MAAASRGAGAGAGGRAGETEAARIIVSMRSLLAVLDNLMISVPEEWRDRPHLYKEEIRKIKDEISKSSEVDLTALMARLLCLDIRYEDLIDAFSRLVPDEYDRLVLAAADARLMCIEKKEAKL